jgi:hypothetical protein
VENITMMTHRIATDHMIAITIHMKKIQCGHTRLHLSRAQSQPEAWQTRLILRR